MVESIKDFIKKEWKEFVIEENFPQMKMMNVHLLLNYAIQQLLQMEILMIFLNVQSRSSVVLMVDFH